MSACQGVQLTSEPVRIPHTVRVQCLNLSIEAVNIVKIGVKEGIKVE